MRELRERGVEDAEQALRLGAAALAKRCCAAFDQRGDVSAGWLFVSVRNGGQWIPEGQPAAPRRETASDLLRALDIADTLADAIAIEAVA